MKSAMKQPVVQKVDQKVLQLTTDKKIINDGADLLSSSDIELENIQLKIKEKEASTLSLNGFGRKQTFNPN